MKSVSLALALGLVAAPLAVGVPSLAHAQAAAPSEDARLTAFLDARFAEELELRPQVATQIGEKVGRDRLNDISDAGLLKVLAWRRGAVAAMKAQFDRARLSPDLQVSYDMFALELERNELSYKFRRYNPPFYSFLYSIHSELPDFLINTHTVSDAADMRAYNARLRAIGPQLDVGIARSRASAAEGIRAPRFEYERVIAGSRQLTTGAPFDGGADSALWADAKAKVGRLQSAGKVTAAEADALLAETRAALLGLKPAYQRVIAWGEGDIGKAPSGKVGAGSLPGGAAWYAAALKLNTTTDLTAEQVHRLGLSEVARIEGEQEALARQAGFAGREAYYAERERLFPPVPWTDARRAEYMAAAKAALADARSKLPKFFGLLPAYKVEVVREPSFSEVAGGAAHASGPSPDGTRPGRVFVHQLGVTGDPAEVYDLMCHEGIPGHVMQGDIQVRQKGGPKFRRAYRYVAYGEGWGLYSEALCKEMGVYPDVAADFMRLDQELFRAARLVTDTGLHAKGWSEDQGVDYMTRVGRLAPQMARSEVRRYLTLPGQATGYKIGMIKIVELRRKAERELGPKFDIRGYNDLVVGMGSVPLKVLEAQVDAWIAKRK